MDKPTEEYRIRRYQFSMPMFCELFMTGNKMSVKIKEGWPEDSRIVGLHSDEKSYSFTVLVESKEFDLVPLKGEIPSGTIIFAPLGRRKK